VGDVTDLGQQPSAIRRRHLENNRLIRVGLIGDGIQASRSPSMHMTEAESNGLRLTYELLDLEKSPQALSDTLVAAQARGFAGVNITHPYKQAVIPLLDNLSDDAQAIGAVNTVVFHRGWRSGHNTDCFGFAESFRRGMPDARLGRAAQIGAGGAGAAVAYGLLMMGAHEVTVFDIRFERAAALAEKLGARFGAGRIRASEDVEADVAAADGIVNATPIGMASYPGTPIPAAWLRRDHWFSEVIYFPLQTELLRLARLAGCASMDGGGMAVFQAVEAFRLFTGVRPDAERILRRFREQASAS
jgi:shikimate dehydrogenase